MPKSVEQMQEMSKYFKCGESVTVTAQTNGFVVSQESYQRGAATTTGLANPSPELFICQDINEVIQRLAAMLTYELELAEVQREKKMQEEVSSLTEQVSKLTSIVETRSGVDAGLKHNDAPPSES